jgi:hypothetical protein
LEQAIEIIPEETRKLDSLEGSVFLRCIDVQEVAEVYVEADEPDEVFLSVLVWVARLGALVL